MNQDRRKRIEEIEEQIADLTEALREIMDEEQSAYDNLPESIQQSARGEAMEQAVSSLEEAISSLEYVPESLQAARESA